MRSLVFSLAIFIAMSVQVFGQVYNMSTTSVSTCAGTFYDNGGSGSNYSNSQNLTMTFTSDNGQRISFNFQSFSLYGDGSDYLDIFDGPTNQYPLIGRYYYTTSPGIVTSTDTCLTFVFYSNSSSTGTGWNANISCAGAPLTVYNMTSGTITTCSGVFYDNGGAGAVYPHNDDRTMTFSSGTSDMIAFTFTNFSVSVDDTLFAYDGPTTASQLIGAYTGTMIPEVVYSHSGSDITWRFKSNTVNNSSGWKATISCVSTAPSLTFNMQDGIRYTCGGVFYDNGGSANNYANNTIKTQTFYSFNGNRISFNFQSFALYGDGSDYLEIYDGPTTSYPKLGTYYYNSSPGIVTSSGSCLTFYFNSNSSSSGTGWSANISCITPVLTVYPMTSGTITACEGVFCDNGGQAAAYPHNENRTMSFSSGTSDYIAATFSHFSVVTDDTLYAYDGPTTSSPLIGAYTGTFLPEVIYSKSGNTLTFLFKSNTSNNSTGWRAFISCSASVPAQTFTMQDGIRYTCGGTFYDDGGTGNYSNSLIRTMTFYSDNGNCIKFDFSAFALYGDGSDYLEIYDGPNMNYPKVGTYYYNSNPGSITSTSTSLTFRFYSNSSSSGTGWTAAISCTTPPPADYPMTSGTVTTCDGVFSDNGGLAANYPHNENRTMTFTSGTSDMIIFTFTHFALILGDTLFAYDGSNVSAPLIGAYTGDVLPENIYSESGNSVTFKFVSNTTGNDMGWKAMVTCSSTAPVLNYLMSDGIRSVCEGTFYDDGGASGSYYNSNTHYMTFVSENGNRVRFDFSAFSLYGDGSDYLEIYDGPNTSWPKLGTYYYNSNPGTIESTGSSLTFKSYSNSSYSSSGWVAGIQCTTAPLTDYPMSSGTVTTCSAVFSDNGGQAGVYPHNENRTMTFTSGTTDKIIFHFTHFAIVAGDTLYAYDGPNTSSPLIGTYYGYTIPEDIYSESGNSVTFRFVSNITSNDAGWRAIVSCSSTLPALQYNMADGSRYVCEGIFTDDGGTSNYYSNNQNKVMTFYSETGSRLQFDFTFFGLYGDGYDYLEIYDGSSASSPFIGRYYYNSNPGTVQSTGNVITFKFYSNSSSPGSGWSANISCTTPALPQYTMYTTTVTTCEAVFYDTGGPSAQYGNDVNETMTFIADGSPYIIFDFTHFNIANDDTLFVYDGLNISAPLIGKYYGTQLPEKLYNKTSTGITFRFVSNTANVADGWRALVTCASTPPAQIFNMQYGVRYTCGGTFYDDGGALSYYSNSLYRAMTFYSDNGNRIRFNFNGFTTESGWDKLYIYDGPTSSYPLLGTYSGSSNPGSVQSTGTCLTFVFNSDGSNTYSGWNADISCTTPPLDYYPISGGTVNTCSGVFFDSGGGNNSYLNNESITQTFCSDNGQYIVFDFTHFAVNLDDTLYAYDGTNTSSQLIGKYYGTQLPEKIYSKSGTCVTFRFVSGTTNTSSGWRALISCSATPPQQDFLVQYGVRYTCGGTFYDDGGASGNYSASATRIMTFISPDNSRLNFNFTTFTTESGWDRLYVYDGPSNLYPLIGTYSGSISPGSITSTGNTLTFISSTDGSNQYSGWTAAITCTTPALTSYPMTSGTVNTCSGVFYDNAGPSANYPHNENRTITFCSDNGNFIKFNFQQNNFVISSEDSLYVYDGPTTASPLLAIFTGNSLPEEISSQSGTCLTFMFYSNTTTNAIGWQSLISCSTSPAAFNNFPMSGGVRYTCNATFTDPGGSTGFYGASENRTMTFRSNSGCPISVTFTSFSTETGWDKLYIYDGNNTSATLLGTFSGSTLPGPFTSTGNALTFRFTSDGSNQYAGWVANLTCTQAGITAVPGLNACPGETVTLTATAGDSYLWSNSATTQSVDVTSSGIYSVTVVSGACNLVSNPVYVSFFTASSVSITPSGPTTFCQGNSVNLTATAGSSYLWNTTQTSQTITANAGGDYYVTVTSVNGCTAVAGPVTVTVNTTPTEPTVLYGNTSLCSGATSQAYSIDPVSGATSYNWTVPGDASIVSGQGTTSIVVDWGTTSGYIYVTAQTTTCSSTALDTYITVLTVPSTPSSISGPASPCEGSTQYYSVTNVAGVNYVWTIPSDWSIIGGTNTNIIQVTVGATSGDITVTPFNSCGGGSLQLLSVFTSQLPSATSSITGNITPCDMTTATYEVTDIPGCTFNWSIPGGWTVIGGTTGYQVTIIPQAPGGTISVCAVNSCGSGPLTYQNITPASLPSVDLGLDSTICENDAMILSVPATFNDYSWSTGATGVNFISLDTAALGIGTYLIGVTVTDNNGCTGSDYVSVTFEICSYSSNATTGNDILIFPNPAHSTLFIKLNGEMNGVTGIHLYDLQGRLLESVNTIYNTTQLDMSGYPQGMYVIKINGNGMTHISRIVKN